MGYVSITDAGKRTLHPFCASVKRGSLGGKPCVRGTPFVPKLSRACAPKRVFGFFLHEQKETRPQAKLRTHPRRASPGALAAKTPGEIRG